jgi:hypothetical protein
VLCGWRGGRPPLRRISLGRRPHSIPLEIIMTALHLARISVGVAALVACEGARSVAPQPTVYFTLVPYACSSIIPVQLYIDSSQVATDTFRIAVAGGDHTTSRALTTSAGQHTLGARVVNGYVWPDKLVSLAVGEVFTDSLPFYCS